MVNYSSIVSLGFSVYPILLFYIIPTCNANAVDICALNEYLLSYLLTYSLRELQTIFGPPYYNV